MLTPELRTIDLKEFIDLWENDKTTLINRLLSDYNELKDAHRKLWRQYNYYSTKGSEISRRCISIKPINYQKELGLDKYVVGHIKLTNDIKQNIDVTHDLKERSRCFLLSRDAYIKKDIIRLKAKEIAELLKDLKVKINYTKDFERHLDDWLSEDVSITREEDLEV